MIIRFSFVPGKNIYEKALTKGASDLEPSVERGIGQHYREGQFCELVAEEEDDNVGGPVPGCSACDSHAGQSKCSQGSRGVGQCSQGLH